ncbi:hypothetical protein [Aeromicrobium sp. P5_D10]
MNTIEISRTLGLCVVAALVTTALPATSASAAPAPAKLSLVASSNDGAAFDFDEYAAGDISVQVTDSIAGKIDVDDMQDLNFSWTVKPFGANAAVVRVPATGTDTVATDTNGEFAVPLPAGQGPGTYTLSAGLGPDASAAHGIGSAVLLTVKAGDAEVTFSDASPLRAVAGSKQTIAGALRLEDGTGLPGRLIDVDIDRGGAGTDPQADAGFVPVLPDTAPVDSLQVTTGAKGTFTAVLSDPVEDGQGTELGGTIEASTASTPDIGNADAGATLDIDLVSTTAPSGSTAVLADFGGGIPGLAVDGTLTVTAPDDTFDVDPTTPDVQGDADSDPDPVEGQVYSLTLDHGFFTTGQGAIPSVVGAPAGDLVQLGTTLTGITNADGEVEFQTGIARDKGFDDDGRVAANVKATAGGPTSTKSVAWDSFSPLNGKVAITLSPANEQTAPVNPSVAGNNTYYEVFALDQFGNRVGGKPVDLTYTGDLDDWDYSDDFVVSDFDTFGDIWITSFEAAKIKATGTWQDAPTTRYVDAAGSTIEGTSDATGSATAAFYEVNFNSSKFSLTSSAKDVVKVGTAVTETVRVVDQLGRPVRGNVVRFFRIGPDKVRSDAVATRTTNARGEASYTFVGTKLGRARITAEVTDGTNSRILRKTVDFGATIKARLVKGKGGSGADRLTVSAKSIAAGARVQLYRVVKGKRFSAGVKKLNRTGKVAFKVRDRNRRAYTSYVAVIRSTSKSVADQSNTVKIR